MSRLYELCCLVLVGLILCGNCSAQESAKKADIVLDEDARDTVIDNLFSQINRIYPYPDVAKQMEDSIRSHQAKHDYAKVTSGMEFAKVLTDQMREVCKDLHLEVQCYPNGIPYDSEKPPVAEDVAKFRETGRRRNYQFKKVEQLDGSVGLLQIDGFYPAEWIGETAAGAMSFLANSEAIILDLRKNGGGATGGNLICSYFLSEETHLRDFHNRSENTTKQIWSYPVAGAEKFANMDLYILTSNHTFSAPEAFAYDLQALKRATIVGERTGGASGPTTIFKVTDTFSASIPFCRSVNIVTKTDFGGTGVIPDVAVPADQAPLTAHLLALNKSLKKYAHDPEYVERLKRTITEKEKELETLKSQVPK